MTNHSPEAEQDISPEESIKLIRSMINKTKDAVAVDSFYFLFWGWLVFVCCLLHFVLKVVVHYPYHYFVWWMMPLGGIISAIYSTRQQKRVQTRTYVEEALGYLWIGIAICFMVLVFINVSTNAWQSAFTYYILLYAIGTFVSGRLLKFNPLVIGGFINFILAGISSQFGYDYQLLIGALAILTSYIIPGHMLRMRYQPKK